MQVITSRHEIKSRSEECLIIYKTEGLAALVVEFHQRILEQKIKFPLLEYCATIMYEAIPEKEHILFCDSIEKLKTIGGNVIIGIFLQKKLTDNFELALKKAAEYISYANAWYICDIVGERVWGMALLKKPVRSVPEIKKLFAHESCWVVRSLGAGIHYSIKKGLDSENVEKLFCMLLDNALSKDKEIKQGVGWAAKTTAKFHPEIIDKYKQRISDEKQTGTWFRTKIKIGISRYQYAFGNRG